MLFSFLRSKKSLFIITLVGILFLIASALLRTPPKHIDVRNTPRNAEFVTSFIAPVKPNIKGYGIVKPSVLIEKNAEVSGRVVYTHPKLISGALLEKGTLVIKIDDIDYQLLYKQAVANIAVFEAQLQEVNENKASLESNLVLVEQKLQLSQKELKRKQNLRKNSSVSQSIVDEEQIKALSLKQEVVSLKQQLAVIPSQINVLHSQLVSANAQAEQQQRNIDRTNILMPITGRITETDIELDQFASLGQTLVKIHGIEQV